MVRQQDGNLSTMFAFEIAGDRIRRIWAVRNSEQLRPWRIS
ncbi:hypothetical protein [Streptomyces sp. P17]|nr:hypothetical protein [Streptomyces sp. P17]